MRNGGSWKHDRPRHAGWGAGGESGLGILTWCGCAEFQGPCRNACTPLGPCEDLGKGRKGWIRQRPSTQTSCKQLLSRAQADWEGEMGQCPDLRNPGRYRLPAVTHPHSHWVPSPPWEPLSVTHQRAGLCHSPWGSPGPAGRR